jgi:hypothetical protein
MQFPLTLSDISLWIAITAIILLVTSELLFSYSGDINFPIDKKHMRLTALILVTAFMVTVLIRVIAPLLI